MTGRELVGAVAADLGVGDLSEAEVEALLRVAAVAAHGSERLAAPLVCYLVGRAGLDPVEAVARVEALAPDGA